MGIKRLRYNVSPGTCQILERLRYDFTTTHKLLNHEQIAGVSTWLYSAWSTKAFKRVWVALGMRLKLYGVWASGQGQHGDI